MLKELLTSLTLLGPVLSAKPGICPTKNCTYDYVDRILRCKSLEMNESVAHLYKSCGALTLTLNDNCPARESDWIEGLTLWQKLEPSIHGFDIYCRPCPANCSRSCAPTRCVGSPVSLCLKKTRNFIGS
jgi:hypothetical protein